MHILFNGQLMAAEELRLSLSNRAFQYNDGFFETMIVKDGVIRFWQDHVERIQEATKVLRLQLPVEFTSINLLENNLLRLAETHNAFANGRLKLKVWRGGAGLFTPETNAAEWLATVQATVPAKAVPVHMGVCQTVHTSYSPFSSFKGPHALLYVLAGTEKKETAFDDLLLLSCDGSMAELISSNLFWYWNNTLYTPALETGCVNGILRRNIIRYCKGEGIAVQEVKMKLNDLPANATVFAGNVTGIKLIHKLNNKDLTVSCTFVDKLQADLKLR
ncbi:aminotransferase class IV [Pontibacter sp. SGAir0037]|uniref:aminotransferase class IV n=1 Tax=Pontibacter sp. SGAir0037 TaxID=2571030 RepID=UPI0010CD25B0|nr:aminotransferase class IV [Pontibacter sp. SGAir0037]QCR21954.1 hypothetical protein C1N53_06135 [Pontibacter sp. SGAir0037]